jgi:hypothetical protein
MNLVERLLAADPHNVLQLETRATETADCTLLHLFLFATHRTLSLAEAESSRLYLQE